MLTPPGSPSPDNLTNPFAREKQPPTDTSVIGDLLGADAAKDFTALLPHQEQEIPQKADLPGGELALTAEEAAQAKAREQEQTLEQQARAWLLGLGKDEEWIEEHFTFEDGITCIAETLDLSNCNITELPSFFGEIKEIKNLNLSENLLITLQNIPKEIGRDLRLSHNPSLTSCAGLEGVHVGRDLYLINNPSLTSCAGLEGVHVGRDLYLSNNPNLKSCAGLEGVHVGRDLYLSYNPNLKSCAGMKRVEVEKNINLSFNDNLRSCAGLEDVHVGGDIVLAYSPYLTSPEGLPPKENIKGNLLFSYNQESLIQKAKLLGYKSGIL